VDSVISIADYWFFKESGKDAYILPLLAGKQTFMEE